MVVRERRPQSRCWAYLGNIDFKHSANDSVSFKYCKTLADTIRAARWEVFISRFLEALCAALIVLPAVIVTSTILDYLLPNTLVPRT